MGSMEFKIDPARQHAISDRAHRGSYGFQEEVATVNGSATYHSLRSATRRRRPTPGYAYSPKAIVWIDNSGDTTISRSRRLLDALTCTSALWRWTDPRPELAGPAA